MVMSEEEKKMKRIEIKTTNDIERRLRDFILDAKDLERIDKRDKYCDKKWVAVDDMLKLINQKLITIPHYTDGETHLQYLERYKQYIIKQLAYNQ